MPSHWQGSAQTHRYGQDHVHVSLSQTQVNKKEPMMTDISGRSGTTSSRSAALQSSLENRLRVNLEGRGYPTYVLKWKHWDMQSGPPIYALRGSVPRISGNASGSWATPTARDWKDTLGMSLTWTNPDGSVRNRTDRLMSQIILSQWPTPVTSESTHCYGGWNKDGSRNIILKLTGTAKLLSVETVSTAPSQLNPRFSLWLMGFPIEWAYCGEQVTPSSLK